MTNIVHVKITATERGAGRPVLLLHGGGGLVTVADFAERLANDVHVRVITPNHPGFGGSERPDGLTTVRQLAQAYTEFLDEHDLRDVVVIGNSMGGWIASEIGVLGSPRVAKIVLVDAVGVALAGHEGPDFFSLTLPEIADYSYYEPDKFRIDPATLPAPVQAAMAGNRAALAAYTVDGMSDPSLEGRLHDIQVPTLVVWGEADRIADPEVGRAFAAAIPSSTFVLLEHTGHLPQMETPELLLDTISEFVSA